MVLNINLRKMDYRIDFKINIERLLNSPYFNLSIFSLPEAKGYFRIKICMHNGHYITDIFNVDGHYQDAIKFINNLGVLPEDSIMDAMQDLGCNYITYNFKLNTKPRLRELAFNNTVIKGSCVGYYYKVLDPHPIVHGIKINLNEFAYYSELYKDMCLSPCACREEVYKLTNFINHTTGLLNCTDEPTLPLDISMFHNDDVVMELLKEIFKTKLFQYNDSLVEDIIMINSATIATTNYKSTLLGVKSFNEVNYLL